MSDKPSPASLYPTLETAEAVLQLGLSQLPITNPNQLVGLFMTLQNTLLSQPTQDKDSQV